MTIEEKAKAYDEALDRAKKELQTCGSTDCDAARQIFRFFPQLRESEDEQTRRQLIEFISDIKRISESGRESWAIREGDIEMCNAFLAYLEKQKEKNGEDEECTDFTIYHPLKDGKGEYECIPYSFYGSLTSFSEDKDLIDFLRTCFYTKEECNEWIEQQKEQKPADFPVTDEEVKEFLETHQKVEVPEKYKTPDFVFSKQDYSGLTDLERAIHRCFLSAGVENVPVTIIKETAKECKRTQTIANENAGEDER